MLLRHASVRLAWGQLLASDRIHAQPTEQFGHRQHRPGGGHGDTGVLGSVRQAARAGGRAMEPRRGGVRTEERRGADGGQPAAGGPGAAVRSHQPCAGEGGPRGAAAQPALRQVHQARDPERHQGGALVDHLRQLHHGGPQRPVPLQHEHRGQVQPRQVGALRAGVLRGEVLQVDGG